MKQHLGLNRKSCFAFLVLSVTFWGGINNASFCDDDPTIPVYHLFETSFPVSLSFENPYDSLNIQVDAEIQRNQNDPFIIPCFFDGGGWKFRYTPSSPGLYTYRVIAKTSAQSEECSSGVFRVTPNEAPGFVRIGKNSRRHFVFENGNSYFPLGENMGWVQWSGNPQVQNWIGYLDECSRAGMNWIRIWMCPWGMTELTWTPLNGRYFGYDRYDMVNARVIDGIFQEAEKRGVYIQWVINHHGQYSKETNPIWDENPFNRKNGGFLDEPWEFFTDEQAKRHYRNRLRYLVARWGCSTHLMAWEFWNEINLTSNYDFEIVKQWHEEMASYLRSLDPYDHLLTTSGSGDREELYTINGLDFLQTHAYENNLIGKLERTSIKRIREYPRTPHFFGEMAYDWRGPTKIDPAGVSLHNQLWASVHATADAGTAMTWWWDNWVRPKNLYPHFRALANYLEGVDWDREYLLPMETVIRPQAENWGPFNFIPEIGWGRTNRTRFEIKESGVVEGLEECTQFVHGDAHRDMAPNPIFLFDLDRSVEFQFQISEAAKAGANCIVELDGEQVYQRAFAPAENDSTIGAEGKASLTIPPGRHNIHIRNSGKDWFKVQYYSVDGLVQRPQGFARGNQDRVLLWVQDRLHQLVHLSEDRVPGFISETTLLLPDLSEGEYLVEPFDAYSGESGDSLMIRSNQNGLEIPIPQFEKDMAFHIRRNKAAAGMPLR
ncbi:MAG: DUF5060 domain-containing protein [Candidatus Omnitrophica bacterium]|nr:DUF5060 domain-containing protein [Candidatus Omnitrophota bacterium]